MPFIPKRIRHRGAELLARAKVAISTYFPIPKPRLRITLEDALKGMNVPVFISDTDGKYVAFNEAFARFHRLNENDKGISRRTLDLLASVDVTEHNGKSVNYNDWVIARALRGESGADIEYHLRRKDTGETWIGSYSFGPLRNGAGSIIGYIVTAEDTTTRTSTEQQLRNLSSRLHLALSSAHLGVWDWDVKHNSMSWDDRMFELYGISKENFPDSVAGWEGPLHPEDRKRAIEEVQAALRGERGFDTEFRVVHPDGRVLFLKANGLVLRNPDGTPERMLGVNADITEAKRAEEELRRAYAEVEAKVVMRTAELEAARIAAEEANRAKDLFLATLSHELRTPLSAILSWSQLIERGMLPPEKVKTAIRTITENAWAQSQLISDLLDVSRILTGKINIDRQPILVQDVAGAAIEAIRVTAEQRGLTIEDRFEKSSLYVMADPARLKQALLNLLSNAIKFTPAGGRIVVSVGYANTPGGKDATISIRDTGVGIRPEFLPQLFARFSQADSSSVRVHGGLGLGLSLVRSLVEMQGGSVKAESPGEGKGATFTVALPLLEADIKRAMLELPTAEQARKDALAHLKVLLVEDSDETREALSQVLISYGAALVAAESAEAALRELKRFSPDIIVSDIAMPKESGHSLMRKIRALGKDQGGETPAIALTAFAEPRDRDDAFASGFQEYLTKPIDADRLVRTVARLAASA